MSISSPAPLSELSLLPDPIHLGPKVTAWSDNPSYLAGRKLVIPEGFVLTFETICILHDGQEFYWYVPFPSEPERRKELLLSLAERWGIDVEIK